VIPAPLQNVLDRVPVDNKLLTSLVTVLVTRLLGGLVGPEVGIEADDELVTLAAPLIAGAVVGYFTHNEGSVLRSADEEDGNPPEPMLPVEEAVEAE
jgi:hypothetical protein